jgi:hypothetical protein
MITSPAGSAVHQAPAWPWPDDLRLDDSLAREFAAIVRDVDLRGPAPDVVVIVQIATDMPVAA